MITEKARVEEVHPGEVIFRVSEDEACRSCEMKDECYRVEGRLPVPANRLRGLAPGDLQPGDSVKLTMEGTSLFKLSGIIYGIPLILFLGGLLGGWQFLAPALGLLGENARPLLAFASGILAVALPWLLIVRLDRRSARRIIYRAEKTPPPATPASTVPG